jgi:hypothetical protein
MKLISTINLVGLMYASGLIAGFTLFGLGGNSDQACVVVASRGIPAGTIIDRPLDWFTVENRSKVRLPPDACRSLLNRR